jgi:hypothetical protein
VYISDDISVATIQVEGVVAFLWQSFCYFYIVDIRISTIRTEGIVVFLVTLSVHIVELDCVLTIQREKYRFCGNSFNIWTVLMTTY